MITVHHLNNSRSQRVLWLLEELDVPYEVERYERDAQMLAPKALRGVHPLGKSPVITDGDLTIAESGAIVEYLLERYGQGRLVPAVRTAERLRYTYWLHYAEGSAMPAMVLKAIFTQIPRAPMPAIARPVVRRVARGVETAFVDPQMKLHVDFMESELGKSEWFAGDQFTAADIVMSFPVEAGASRGNADGPIPRLFAFLGRIRARPAYERALRRGGPFNILR